MKVSIVIPFRDRDLNRLSSVVQSFRNNSQTVTLEILLSDYGSEVPTHLELADFCEKNDLRHICSYCEGRPWSRAYAINNGVKAATSDYICIVDVDMVLLDPVFEYLKNNLNENTVYFLESFWPKNKKEKPLKGKVNRSYGVFQFAHKKWFELLSGLDERIEFWGGEDNDWVRRLINAQAKIEWLLAKDFRLIHTWHPTDSTGETRPENAVWKTLGIEVENILVEKKRDTWGVLLKKSDRPVLKEKEENKSFFEVKIEPDKMIERISGIKKYLTEKPYLKITLGPRLETRKLSRFRWFIWQFNDFLKLFSVELKPIINRNFETYIILRDIFTSHIRDYYISKDFSEVYIITNVDEEIG